MDPKIKLPFYLKLACVLIILIAGGYLFILGKELLCPLLFALLFALLLLPLCNFLERRMLIARGIAAILSVIIFFAAVSFIFYLLGSQIKLLMSDWPQLRSQLQGVLYNLQEWTAHKFHVNIQKQTTYLNNAVQNALKSGGSIVESTILSLSSIILFWVFIFIYTIFILYYRKLLMLFIVSAFTDKYRIVIYDIADNIKQIIKKYITGLFFEMAIVAAIAITIFLILGIKFGLLLGLIVGIFNLIPYVGIFSALALSASITFATGEPRDALFVIISVICIHLVDSNFLMPKIVGSQVKINPLLVIIGVVLGEMIWGISGMFLSIPYLAIAKIVFDRVEGLQAWGILLGEETETPKKAKKINFLMKKQRQLKNEENKES